MEPPPQPFPTSGRPQHTSLWDGCEPRQGGMQTAVILMGPQEGHPSPLAALLPPRAPARGCPGSFQEESLVQLVPGSRWRERPGPFEESFCPASLPFGESVPSTGLWRSQGGPWQDTASPWLLGMGCREAGGRAARLCSWPRIPTASWSDLFLLGETAVLLLHARLLPQQGLLGGEGRAVLFVLGGLRGLQENQGIGGSAGRAPLAPSCPRRHPRQGCSWNLSPRGCSWPRGLAPVPPPPRRATKRSTYQILVLLPRT